MQASRKTPDAPLPNAPSSRVDESLHVVLVADTRPALPDLLSATEECFKPPHDRHFPKLGWLLMLAFLLVACGGTPAALTPSPTPTTTPTLTATATAIPTPTFGVPTPAPNPTPYWTLTPSHLVLNSSDCSRSGSEATCILTITYNSNGAEGAASWTATPLDSYGTYLVPHPAQGTLEPPKQSVRVRIEVTNADYFCRLPTGDSIRFSFRSPVPESDHFVGVSCM